MIRRPPRSTLFPLHDALPIWGQAARALPVTDAAAGTRATCLGPNRRDIMAGPQRLTEGNDNWSGFLAFDDRSEEHTSELQSLAYLVCRLLLEKKKKRQQQTPS